MFKILKNFLILSQIIKKTLLIRFSIKNDFDILHECGFLKHDNIGLFLEFKTTLLEQNQEYLDYVKDEEQPIMEKLSN